MMQKKTNVIVKLSIAGIHRWEDCDIHEVDYLKNNHRHMFYFTCKKQVEDADREIEIIMLKNSILNYLNTNFYAGKYGCANFGRMSCEMIAHQILDMFGLNYCKVLEDDENGAEVVVTI